MAAASRWLALLFVLVAGAAALWFFGELLWLFLGALCASATADRASKMMLDFKIVFMRPA